MADPAAPQRFRFPGLIPDVRLRTESVPLLKPDPATLPVNCVHCGGAVTVQVSDWPTTLTIPELDKSPWNVPLLPAGESRRLPRPDRVGLGKRHPDERDV